MKRIIRCIAAVSTIICISACHKNGPEPEPAKPVLTLQNFKTIANGFWPDATVVKTDKKNGNVWIMTCRSTKQGTTPYFQCFDKNMNSLSGDWKPLTSHPCTETVSKLDFDILPNGNAIFAYGDLRKYEANIPLAYFTTAKPDGSLLDEEGTLILDIKEKYPELEGCTIETCVRSDNDGGAFVAVSYGAHACLVHISADGKMGRVHGFSPEYEDGSIIGIDMLSKGNGQVFLTEMDITKTGSGATADFKGISKHRTMNPDTKKDVIRVISPEKECTPGDYATIFPDNQGGGYLIATRGDASGNKEILMSHFNSSAAFSDEDFITIATSKYYNGCHFAVSPSDNALYMILSESVQEGHSITGRKASISAVNAKGESVLDDLSFGEFPIDQDNKEFTIAFRDNKTIDVGYIYHNPAQESPFYNFATGSINLEDKSIEQAICSTPLPVDAKVLSYADGFRGYKSDRINLVWESSDAKVIFAGQVVKPE